MNPEAAAGKPIGRRVFVLLLGAGAAGIAFGARLTDFVETRLGSGSRRNGLLSLLPVGRFRIYTVTGSIPTRSTSEYRLRVDGLVERNLDLDYDDLLALRRTDLTRDFQCVTGWRVRDVAWTGVRLADLLDEAKVTGEARAVRLHSFDGLYTESLTLDQARRDDVIVAYRMYGEDLPRDHGGPARLVVAPMYGYKSLKWLDRIEIISEVVPGYWERFGYDVDAWVGSSNDRFDVPIGGA